MHSLVYILNFTFALLPLFLYFLIRIIIYCSDKHFGDCVTIFNFVKNQIFLLIYLIFFFRY